MLIGLLVAINHVEIDLPGQARCSERPTRYPALVWLASDPFDAATNKLAHDLSEQDIVVVRASLAKPLDVYALAKRHACVDLERIRIVARGELAEEVKRLIASGELTPHVLVHTNQTDPKRLHEELVAAAHSEPAAPLDITRTPYLGLMFSPVDVPVSANASALGLRVDRVLPALAAWRSGLRPLDIVTSLNGVDVGSVPKRDAAARLTSRIRALQPGARATFKVLRAITRGVTSKNGEAVSPPLLDPADLGDRLAKLVSESEIGAEHELVWIRSAEALTISVPITAPEPVLAQAIVPSASDRLLSVFVDTLAKHYPLEMADLFKRLADGSVRGDPFRLRLVDAVQRDPLTLRGVTRDLSERARPEKDPVSSVRKLLRLAREGAWGPAFAEPAKAELALGLDVKGHLAQLKRVLALASDLRNRALAQLTPQEQRSLPDELIALTDKYLVDNYIYALRDPTGVTRTIDLAAKIQLAPMLAAAHTLVALASRNYVLALKAALLREKHDLTKTVVYEEATPQGLIRITGTGDDDIGDLEKVCLLIDLGGNDFYRDRAGAAFGGTGGVSVLVDLDGDDTYDSSADVSLGASVLGVGLLADLAGDDHYLGMRMSQGFGMGGVGVLLDVAGRDEYRVGQLGQAASVFGVGILHDANGDDLYESRSHTQGMATGGGAGLLIDAAGNDAYFAKGGVPSPWGTPGTYACWCQGTGVGMRYLASGGLGLIYDGGGKDRMQGGDFSIGSGYYYGFGIASMLGRDADRYVGDRYTISASAHNAIASFIDEGGDDFYDTRENVGLSIANDYSLTWFLDQGGNDRYAAKTVCGGTSMNNGLALFEDVAGKDVWVGPTVSASGQGNSYHGGTSLSLVALSTQVQQKGKTLAPLEARDQHTLVFRLGKELDELARDTTLQSRLLPLSKATP